MARCWSGGIHRRWASLAEADVGEPPRSHPLLGDPQHVGANIDPDYLAARPHELCGALSHGPGPRPEVKDMLSGGQSGPPDDLLHDWREPPVDLAQIDVGNAVPDPHLPCQPCPFLVCVHGACLSTRLEKD